MVKKEWEWLWDESKIAVINDFIKGFHLSLPTALYFKQDVSNVLQEWYPYVLMGDITFM